MVSRTVWTWLLVTSTAAAIPVACDSESNPPKSESGSGGAGGASTGNAGGAGGGAVGGGGDVATSTASGFVGSSSSSGMLANCEDACGTPCPDGVCDGYECKAPEVSCIPKPPDQPCWSAEQAPNALCGGCEGCAFIGCILAGPNEVDGSCCYDIAGGCVPLP